MIYCLTVLLSYCLTVILSYCLTVLLSNSKTRLRPPSSPAVPCPHTSARTHMPQLVRLEHRDAPRTRRAPRRVPHSHRPWPAIRADRRRLWLWLSPWLFDLTSSDVRPNANPNALTGPARRAAGRLRRLGGRGTRIEHSAATASANSAASARINLSSMRCARHPIYRPLVGRMRVPGIDSRSLTKSDHSSPASRPWAWDRDRD